jgi:hypothetical protein
MLESELLVASGGRSEQIPSAGPHQEKRGRNSIPPMPQRLPDRYVNLPRLRGIAIQLSGAHAVNAFPESRRQWNRTHRPSRDRGGQYPVYGKY